MKQLAVLAIAAALAAPLLAQHPAEHGAAILELLRTSDYGRCVYRMNNDQPDHYIANLLFEGNVTALFRTGDTLRVDPAAGIVEVLNRGR